MTPQQIDAMKLALEALEDIFGKNKVDVTVINVIKEVLAEHAMSEVQRLGQEIEQEPAGWLSTDSIGERYLCFDKPLDNNPVQPLFIAPPQRTWVGLTEQDLDYLCNLAYTGDEEFALAVQAKLMEKNA